MKILKRIIICVLTLALLLSAAGCKKKTDKDTDKDKNTSSKEESSVSENINSDFTFTDSSDLENSSGSNDFATQSKPASGSAGNKTDLSNYPDYTKVYGVSDLAEQEKLKFYYEGMTYAYGITEGGREIIAIIDQNNGDFIDVMSGAGRMSLYSDGGLLLLSAGSIKEYERSMTDGFMKLEVYYDLSGISADKSELITTYTFKDTVINVSQHVRYNGSYTADSSKSFIERISLLNYSCTQKNVVGEWYYPNSGDYPYQRAESIATVLKYDDNHGLYTFVKSDNKNLTIYPETHPELNIPLSFEKGKGVNYNVEYNIVPVTLNGDTSDNYHALFRGRGSDYAVGIFSERKTEENSTVFVGNELDLSLNVTNLISEDVNFSLRYDVRDYYGNIVDSGLFVNNTAKAGVSMDRRIHISGKYGMYYVNLYSVSNLYTHKECYPFALIPTSDYKYRSTNPFGMTSIADNGVREDAISAALLNVKIGTGNYRYVANAKGYQKEAVELMVKNGIKINAQLNMNSVKPTGYKSADELVKAINEYLPKLAGITDTVEVGNEINYSFSEGLESDPADYGNRYINDMYIPASNAVRAAGFKFLGSGISSYDEKWVDGVIGKTSAIWNMMDVISIHPYGFPQMPDIYGNGGTSNKWNYERTLMRYMDSFVKNGQKELFITETGLPTCPTKPMQVDLRTQADYNVRILVLGHRYGAKRIQLYSFFDRRSFGNGYDNTDAEMGYGLFYQPDFLGVIKPKPVAAAYSVLNHITDGLLKTEESSYSRNDGSLRAFKMTLQNSNDLYVVWSNKNPLSNAVVTNQSDRIPSTPWVDQWEGKTEDVTFKAASSKVTVTDVMGNSKTYTAQNGSVTIPISGSAVYIEGIKE